jgi:hypothetical protein
MAVQILPMIGFFKRAVWQFGNRYSANGICLGRLLPPRVGGFLAPSFSRPLSRARDSALTHDGGQHLVVGLPPGLL